MSNEDDDDHDDQDPGEAANEVLVPWQRLSEDALLGVIEEYVTREGTDYGHTDHSLEAKVAAVRRQLEKGEIVVLFDAIEETVNLVSKRALETR